MLARMNEMILALPNPEVSIIGHSYGGWTAMKLMLALDPSIKVHRLITLDPISRDNCSLQQFAKNAEAIIDNASSNSRGCSIAPEDFTATELAAIAAKTEKWVNYYQTTGIFLHSSAITGPAAVTNVEKRYDINPKGFGPHVSFLYDQDLIREIAGDVAAAYTSP